MREIPYTGTNLINDCFGNGNGWCTGVLDTLCHVVCLPPTAIYKVRLSRLFHYAQ
jgi:hypothetical protein